MSGMQVNRIGNVLIYEFTVEELKAELNFTSPFQIQRSLMYLLVRIGTQHPEAACKPLRALDARVSSALLDREAFSRH